MIITTNLYFDISVIDSEFDNIVYNPAITIDKNGRVKFNEYTEYDDICYELEEYNI